MLAHLRIAETAVADGTRGCFFREPFCQQKGAPMPKGNKNKTHKGLAKRVRTTRTGKVLRKKANRGHLMSTKTGKRKRRLRGTDTVKSGRAKSYIEALRPGP